MKKRQSLSQTDRIYAHLKAGNSLTPVEALSLFGCLRLGARIHDLKAVGVPIQSDIVLVQGATGSAHVARYTLASGETLSR